MILNLLRAKLIFFYHLRKSFSKGRLTVCPGRLLEITLLVCTYMKHSAIFTNNTNLNNVFIKQTFTQSSLTFTFKKHQTATDHE